MVYLFVIASVTRQSRMHGLSRPAASQWRWPTR